MKIAVIPARGGSKRIPQKNIKLFCEKPIIAYSIEAALGSGCFDKVIVSTDSDTIKECAENYGAEVPFMRPEDLSDDYTGVQPVVAHVCSKFREQGVDLHLCATLLPTAPTLTAASIRKTVDCLRESKWTKAFLATEFSYPVFRSFTLKDGRPEMLYPECFLKRSQDLKKVYHDAGQLYITTSPFKEKIRYLSSDALPVIIPHYMVQDIDTEDDWTRAEFIYNALKLSGKLQ